MIDFYTNQSNLLFIFDKNVNITFCARNNSIKLIFKFDSENSTLYKIIFFNGDYTESIKYKEGYSAYFGANEKLSGFSETSILAMNSTKYETLKNSLTTGDFRIIINELNFSYGAMPHQYSNVYAKEIYGYLLGKYAELHPIKINLMAWT